MLEPASQRPLVSPPPDPVRAARTDDAAWPGLPVRTLALGHATVLLEVGGLSILTDPVLLDAIGVRLGPVSFGPRRLRAPALSLKELPAIDVVLLSHAHYDHTDRATLRRLPATATVITQPGNLDLVRRFGDRRALGWGESVQLSRDDRPSVTITSLPARHWGARSVIDRWRGFGGYLIEIDESESPAFPGRPTSIVFAGDTAQTGSYRRLYEARGAGCDLAFFPIGAYNPWIFNHCSPEQAWAMAIDDLGAERLCPIHYDTFRLSREPVGEPLERLFRVAEKAGGRDRIVGVPPGAAAHLTPSGFRNVRQ